MSTKTLNVTSSLREASDLLKPETIWRHYKGGIYKTTGRFVFGTKSGEVEVLYKRIDGPNFNPNLEYQIEYSRPVSEWTETVIHNEVVVPRFVEVRQEYQWVVRKR